MKFLKDYKISFLKVKFILIKIIIEQKVSPKQKMNNPLIYTSNTSCD